MLTLKIAAALGSLAVSAWRCAWRKDWRAGRYWCRANWQPPMLPRARAAWRGSLALRAATSSGVKSLKRFMIAPSLVEPGGFAQKGIGRQHGAGMLRCRMPRTASWPSVRILTPCRRAGIRAGNKPGSRLFSTSLSSQVQNVQRNLSGLSLGILQISRISPKNSTSFHLRIGLPIGEYFERRACG